MSPVSYISKYAAPLRRGTYHVFGKKKMRKLSKAVGSKSVGKAAGWAGTGTREGVRVPMIVARKKYMKIPSTASFIRSHEKGHFVYDSLPKKRRRKFQKRFKKALRKKDLTARWIHGWIHAEGRGMYRKKDVPHERFAEAYAYYKKWRGKDGPVVEAVDRALYGGPKKKRRFGISIAQEVTERNWYGYSAGIAKRPKKRTAGDAMRSTFGPKRMAEVGRTLRKSSTLARAASLLQAPVPLGSRREMKGVFGLARWQKKYGPLKSAVRFYRGKSI